MYRLALIIALNLCLCSTLVAQENKSAIFREEKHHALSLPSLMFAVLQSPDYLELPLVLTRDNIPIVLDDIFLNPITNVAEIFPTRNRQDGNYYVVDFSFAEIKQLSYREESSNQKFTQHLTSYEDSLKVIKLLDKVQPGQLRVIPVIKYPWFHLNEGRDISKIILEKTISHATTSDAVLYVQCYDPDELLRIKKSFLAGLPIEVRLIQAIDVKNGRETMRKQGKGWVSYNYDWLFTRTGLMYLSGYAHGVSLIDKNLLEEEVLKRFISMTHEMKINVYIGVQSLNVDIDENLFEKILFSLNADGIALNTPKSVKEYFESKSELLPDFSNQDTFDRTNNGESTIFSDPEALSRRLKRVQQQ